MADGRSPSGPGWELQALKLLPDEEIDTSDIPETTDWGGAVRGKFSATAESGDAHD